MGFFSDIFGSDKSLIDRATKGPARRVKYIDMYDGSTLHEIDMNECMFVPLIPCIGAFIKRNGKQGIVKHVRIDFDSDGTQVDCDAVIIEVMMLGKFPELTE